MPFYICWTVEVDLKYMCLSCNYFTKLQQNPSSGKIILYFLGKSQNFYILNGLQFVSERYSTTLLPGGAMGNRSVKSRKVYTKYQLGIDRMLLKRWKHEQDQIAEQKQIIDDNIKNGRLKNIATQISQTTPYMMSLPVGEMRQIILHASSLCHSLSDRIYETMDAIAKYLSNAEVSESEEEKLSSSYAYLMHIHRQILPELDGSINVFSRRSKEASKNIGYQLKELNKFIPAVETGIPPLPTAIKKEEDEYE